MRLSVKRAWSLPGLLVLLQFAALAAPEPVLAEPIGPELSRAPKDEIERWVPGVSAAMGLLLQRISGDFETGNIQGPSFGPPSPPLIRPPGAGKDLALTPIATFSFEIMTPGLHKLPGVPDFALPGRPRLFLHTDVVPSFAPTYRTAKKDDPGINKFPFAENSFGVAPVADEEQVTGQGGRLKAHVRRWQFAAGAGVAWTLDAWERRLRIKPSFEYMTEEISIQGEVRRVVKQVANPRTIEEFRVIILNASKTKRFHGLGAGIEFELDTRRTGPVLLSVFAGARGYRFMGDLGLQVTATNQHDETATFRLKKKRYGYRGSVGIRLRFAPE